MGLWPNQNMIVLQICRSHGAFKEYFISIAQVEFFHPHNQSEAVIQIEKSVNYLWLFIKKAHLTLWFQWVTSLKYDILTFYEAI